LRPAEFGDLPIEGLQFLFCQIEHTMAGYAAVVAGPENLRNLIQRESQLKSPLCHTHAFN
jgi:hypothetical protein